MLTIGRVKRRHFQIGPAIRSCPTISKLGISMSNQTAIISTLWSMALATWIKKWRKGSALRIGSDTSISFTKYEPLPDEIDHFGIEAYWGDVLELRILRNIFPDLKHFDIRYINLLAYIDGDFSMVDSTLNNP